MGYWKKYAPKLMKNSEIGQSYSRNKMMHIFLLHIVPHGSVADMSTGSFL